MTLELNLGVAFSGSDLPPKSWPALNMNDATKLFMDFTDSRVSSLAAGAAITGATFNDLVPGGATASASASNTYNAQKHAKGIYWPYNASAASNNSQYLNFGSSHRFNLNARWAVGMWFTRVTGNTSTYSKMMGRGTAVNSNANQSSFSIDSSNKNYAARGTVLGSGAGTGVVTVASGALSTGAPHLVVFEFEPGVALRHYIDGALVSTVSTGIPSTLEPHDAGFLSAYLWMGGYLHAVIIEQLSDSGRTGAEFAAAEYAARSAKYV